MNDAAPGDALSRRASRQADLALDLLASSRDAVASGCPLDLHLQRHFRSHSNIGSTDRRFFAQIVNSWFRWRGWVEFAAPEQIGAQAGWAWLLDNADRPEAWKMLLPATSNMPPENDASLLPLDAKAALLCEAFALGSSLALADLFPGLATIDIPDKMATLTALQSRPPTWLAIAPKNREKFCQQAKDAGVTVLNHCPLPDAVGAIPDAAFNRFLRETKIPHRVQSLASQCVGHIANPKPSETWWDACAGAGGKALHLLDLADHRIRIWLTEPRARALSEASARFKSAKLAHAAKLFNDDALTWTGGPEQFNGVVVDAPCSGLGTWARHPDARWRWAPEEVASFVERQTALLASCAKRVAPGGRLVYSVCTLTPEECTGVTQSFQMTHPDFSPAPFLHPITGNSCNGSVHLLPQDTGGDAMWIAMWLRNP